MNISEPVVWRAKTDDPGHAWREGGQLVAASLIPAVLILCAGAAMDAFTGAFWLALLLVPVAAAYAGWSIFRDRRALVDVELAGTEFTLVRRDGSRTTVPASQVRRIDVCRTLYDGTPESITMRLHVGGRAERTRPGPGTLPDGWREAVTIAEVETTYADKRRRNS
ncbi:hypothetical protein [Actinoplanes sp. GCM10030250]|uniref:hypothetical protein n=1 Tax=Actinoplanes sp. GCM10030250 TaxID=3273376 RepID=UPI003620A362